MEAAVVDNPLKCSCGARTGSRNTNCPACGIQFSDNRKIAIETAGRLIIKAGTIMAELEKNSGLAVTLVEECRKLREIAECLADDVSDVSDMELEGLR